MAQVVPAEPELRRVIGDGAAVPDGEVDGLEERDLLELYRWMVLLRTYDERSVVFHRQGRIGTYAIFWNHEAMQAGSVYALGREDWIFPSYRESAIGLLRGMPVSTVLSWWRGHPAGWWNPLDYNVVGYGIPAARVDGCDVLAVYEATRDAVARARAGEGPTFIEAVSYRTAPHATADDPHAYIDLDRVEEEKARECLGRYEAYLRRGGVLSDELAESTRAEAAEALRAGIAAAEAEPPADASLLFEHAYAAPPSSFAAELEELKGILGE